MHVLVVCSHGNYIQHHATLKWPVLNSQPTITIFYKKAFLCYIWDQVCQANIHIKVARSHVEHVNMQ